MAFRDELVTDIIFATMDRMGKDGLQKRVPVHALASLGGKIGVLAMTYARDVDNAIKEACGDDQ